jgi:hypothetical protein
MIRRFCRLCDGHGWFRKPATPMTAGSLNIPAPDLRPKDVGLLSMLH